MVKMNFEYTENLGVQALHEPSKAEIKTAAPKDNNGDGSSFSPTDLLASATVTCMITLMGINANKNGIDISGTKGSVEKHMFENPRRIGKLVIEINVPQNLKEAEQKMLKVAALNCPVVKSINPEIKLETNIHFKQ